MTNRENIGGAPLSGYTMKEYANMPAESSTGFWKNMVHICGRSMRS